MTDAPRGSGRTHSQIANLRPGDIFIVGNHGMMEHAQRIADKIGLKGLKIMVAPDVSKLMGLDDSVYIAVDHMFSPKSEELRQRIYLQNSRSGR